MTTVRRAAPEHTDFVLALVPELAAFGPPPWRRTEQMVDTDTLVIGRALQNVSTDATVLIAEDANGKPLGFTHVCGERDYYSRVQCGHIADLVVAPDARGRGVGEALIAAERLSRVTGISRWARCS